VIDGPALVLTVAATAGSGLVAGVFFAFSTFVMAALRRLQAARGIEAMQAINVTAVTPLFMFALFATAVVCVVLGVVALVDGGDGSALVLAGVLVYIVTTIIVTIAYHVPRNDALAEVDPNAPAAANAWSVYTRQWTRMNHVRTLGALAACVCFAIALPAG
jgi:uncharacterized membrane protein